MHSRKKAEIKVYIVSIGAALALGALSALVSMNGMKDYAALKQPPLSPPGWLFPVVWTLLYTLMGISAARVYLKKTSDIRPALILYAAQLIVNLIWSPLFFALKLRLVAFVWLLLLICLVVIMTIRFKKIDKTAAYLQIPYIVWLLFAAYLNLAVFILNG